MSSNLNWFVQAWQAWIIAISWQLVIWVVLISAIAWLARGASPRVRYLLWLLVLVKVFVPPSLALPWGVGNWGIHPVWQQIQEQNEFSSRIESVALPATAEDVNEEGNDSPGTAAARTASPLFLLWAVGCGGVWLMAVWQYYRLRQATREMELVEEGPLRFELERLALELGEKQVPDLYLSSTAASPYLFGILRPKMVIPRELMDTVSESDQRSVLAHELCHWGGATCGWAGCK